MLRTAQPFVCAPQSIRCASNTLHLQPLGISSSLCTSGFSSPLCLQCLSMASQGASTGPSGASGASGWLTTTLDVPHPPPAPRAPAAAAAADPGRHRGQPWGSPDAWTQEWGLDRLRDLPPAPPAPQGLVDGGEHRQVLRHMQEALEQAAEPEWIHDRVAIWRSVPEHLVNAPTWMTLMPDQDLKCYKSILQDDLNLDWTSIGSWVELVRNGRLGYQEGCRILAHLVKDSSSSSWRSTSGPSGWLARATAEAQEAIANWREWDAPPPQSTSSSSSAPRASWQHGPSGWHGSSWQQGPSGWTSGSWGPSSSSSAPEPRRFR